MEITNEHIATRRKVGTLNKRPVIEIVTTGGLHLWVCAKSDGVQTLAAAPHRAVARHIAKKRHPDMIITELSKSDWIDPICFQHLLPEWEHTTDRFCAIK